MVQFQKNILVLKKDVFLKLNQDVFLKLKVRLFKTPLLPECSRGVWFRKDSPKYSDLQTLWFPKKDFWAEPLDSVILKSPPSFKKKDVVQKKDVFLKLKLITSKNAFFEVLKNFFETFKKNVFFGETMSPFKTVVLEHSSFCKHLYDFFFL